MKEGREVGWRGNQGKEVRERWREGGKGEMERRREGFESAY